MKEISYDEWYELLNKLDKLDGSASLGAVFGILSFVGLFLFICILWLYHSYTENN